MGNRVFVIFIISILIFLNCRYAKIKGDQDINFDADNFVKGNFMEDYNYKWLNYPIVEKKIVDEVNKIIPGKYTVIWKGDMDADEITDYFIVIKDEEIYHGIKKGLIIDANGKVKLFIDIEKGAYTSKYIAFDFKKIGIRKNEVRCIRLLFDNNDLLFDKSDHKYHIKDLFITKEKYATVSTGLGLQLIDKNGNVIDFSHKKEWIPYGRFQTFKNNIIHFDRVDIKFAVEGPEGEEGTYRKYRLSVEQYRISKAKGIVFRAINFIPKEK